MRWLVVTAMAGMLVLSGCGGDDDGAASGSTATGTESSPPAASGQIPVVTSTDVYADIVRTIGGDAVEVQALASSDSGADPHSYEASARDQLAVKDAQLVIANGGHYDDFLTQALDAAGGERTVLTAVTEAQHEDEGEGALASSPTPHDHGEDGNEHVWYDLKAMNALATKIAGTLSALRPADSAVFTSRAGAFQNELSDLRDRQAAIREEHSGVAVAVTEPLPLFLLADCGLVDKTPEGFSEAIEEGTDVPARVLQDTLDLFADGAVGRARLQLADHRTADRTRAGRRRGGRDPGGADVRDAARRAGLPQLDAGQPGRARRGARRRVGMTLTEPVAGSSSVADVTAVLSLRDASLHYGQRHLWEHLNLELAPGEFLAVLGPNGSGKTSLLRVVLGLTPLTSGHVEIAGQPVRRGNRLVGYVPQQHALSSASGLRPRDLVRLGVDGHRWGPGPTPNARARVDELLAAVGATSYADAPLGMLSGGEQQRVRIAQALATDPRLLLCDEPLLSLDLAHQRGVVALLDARRQQGTAVVMVTHEINPILPVVDRVLFVAPHGVRLGTAGRDPHLTGADRALPHTGRGGPDRQRHRHPRAQHPPRALTSADSSSSASATRKSSSVMIPELRSTSRPFKRRSRSAGRSAGRSGRGAGSGTISGSGSTALRAPPSSAAAASVSTASDGWTGIDAPSDPSSATAPSAKISRASATMSSSSYTASTSPTAANGTSLSMLSSSARAAAAASTEPSGSGSISVTGSADAAHAGSGVALSSSSTIWESTISGISLSGWSVSGSGVQCGISTLGIAGISTSATTYSRWETISARSTRRGDRRRAVLGQRGPLRHLDLHREVRHHEVRHHEARAGSDSHRLVGRRLAGTSTCARNRRGDSGSVVQRAIGSGEDRGVSRHRRLAGEQGDQLSDSRSVDARHLQLEVAARGDELDGGEQAARLAGADAR